VWADFCAGSVRFASEGGVVVGVDQAEHSVGDYVVQADLVDESQVQSMYEQVVRRYAATAQMAYAAAKGGVVQLTRDLAVHTARSGVRVNAVLFGPIDTADQRAVFDRNPGALEKRLVHWPMGRFGTLAEAAGTIAFLASDDSGFITAAALPLDGGINEAFTVPE
jgi:enoyl-[acyl-carrier-protein] reductase (NADH)